jgi:hypothetical protein
VGVFPSIFSPSVQDEDGNAVPGSEFVTWKQRVYQKRDKPGKVRFKYRSCTPPPADKGVVFALQVLCTLDEAMLKDGGVRRHVPLYDYITKKELPLADAAIHGNDVVSVQTNVCVGFGF